MAEQLAQNVVEPGSASVSALAGVDGQLRPTTDLSSLDSSKASDALPTDSSASVNGAQTNVNIADKSEATGTNSNIPGNGTYDEASQAGASRDGGSTPEPSVDHSANGDTDTSKGDPAERREDNHARTNSVKKPTTFSKVSVTKTFMAKAASPAPASVKLGEKASPAGTVAQPLARPRLVAKTGSGLQNMQKPRMGSEGAGGPDASKVWNKNRPTPQPPPKHFTDEELKQQYGIHLATRLQTDEDGKESKWADIDDEEDDWAPEAVVWMDGTKSTVAAADAPVPEPEPKQSQSQAQPVNPVENTKAATSTPKKPIELGPQKTILKPGIAAQQARQQIGGSATPATDKPSLKAKSPAPTPSKSPWAALPPVEAVSPVIPPTYQPPVPAHTHASLPTQDARAYDTYQPAPPAREIAADTFDRSWREGEGGSKELFNSANGRYEPVLEGGRRGSMKHDGSLRKPAVLQRPAHGGPGPAEPSAAFQTRSNIQMDGNGSWNRRRGSSISQGSLPPGRRISVSKGSDTVVERRGSNVIPHEARSPQSIRAEPGKPNFAQQSAWDQQMPTRPEAATEVVEDPVLVQERVMREKRAAREQEIKRRQEIEQREVAERQERLKARMAALEGAGKSRKEREAEAAASTVPDAKPATPDADRTSATAKVQSAPIDPPSDGAREKVSAAPSENAPAVQLSPEGTLPSLASLPSKPQAANASERSTAATDNADLQTRSHMSPRANARGSGPFGQQASTYKPAQPSFNSPGDRKPQGFAQSVLASEPFAPWGASVGGNVWGSSGIGNGTFEKASSFAPMPISQQNSALPPPPGMGMTRPTTSSRISPSAPGQESRSPIIAEQVRTFAPPGIEARPDASWGPGRGNGMSAAPGLGRQTHLPAPIGPPSRVQQSILSRPDPIGPWSASTQRLSHEFLADGQSAEQNRLDRATSSIPGGTIKETFKRTSVPSKVGGPRRVESTEYTVHDSQGSRSVPLHSPLPPNAQSQPSGIGSMTSPFNESTVRIPDGSSSHSYGGLGIRQPPIGPPGNYLPPHLAKHRGSAQASPPDADDLSLPPPGISSHPVNSGDSHHPHVRLPPPPPVVKLPPQASSMPPAPSAIPQRPPSGWGPQGSRPIVQSEDWQARFNGLFNRAPISTEVPPSPPKTPPKTQGASLAVASSSKAPLHEVSPSSSATVSLPHGKALAAASVAEVVSKPVIEETFNEELSFGSLPTIRLPNRASYNAEKYSVETNHNMLKDDTESTVSSTIETQSRPMLDHSEVKIFWRSPHGIFVKILSTPLNNKLVKHKYENRKVSTTKDHKSTFKARKGKGKSPVPGSPVTTGSSSETPKKTGLPKASTPAPSSPATPSGSVNKKPLSSKAAKNRQPPISA